MFCAPICPLISDMIRDKVHVVNSTAIEIYFKRKNAWNVEWAGAMLIIGKSIWENVPLDYNTLKANDPATDDKNNNDIVDLKEDGTGAWTFDNYIPGNYITLKAYDKYYLTQAYIKERLAETFHYSAGDVDESNVVGIRDLGLIHRALGTQQGKRSKRNGLWRIQPNVRLGPRWGCRWHRSKLRSNSLWRNNRLKSTESVPRGQSAVKRYTKLR